jgi:hypothetical protein
MGFMRVLAAYGAASEGRLHPDMAERPILTVSAGVPRARGPLGDGDSDAMAGWFSSIKIEVRS